HHHTSHYSPPRTHLTCCFSDSAAPRALHSFPTRRSSDLRGGPGQRRRTAPRHRAGTARLSDRDVHPVSGSGAADGRARAPRRPRSEEHTSELQSRENLVCRLLLEKKKHKKPNHSALARAA